MCQVWACEIPKMKSIILGWAWVELGIGAGLVSGLGEDAGAVGDAVADRGAELLGYLL